MKKATKKGETSLLLVRLRTFFGNKRAVALTAILLAVCILAATLLAIYLPAGAVCYRYGGRAMREEVYRYYFACLKYDYLVRYKALGISDTPDGWQKVGEDGKTLEESFKSVIEEELKLRLIASRLFDSLGLSLPASDYEDISKLLSDLETYSYDESPYTVLKETYGIRAKRVVKQVALYEKKYAALVYELFGEDGSGVFSAEYKEDLALFYEKYYYRYNVIFIKDDSPISSGLIRDALADGVTPAEFEALERDHSDMSVTSGDYPHGIYLYGGGSYNAATTGLDDSLLAAMRTLEKAGDYAEARSDDDDGTFFVLRYELDDAPYLEEGEWVKTAFADLPATAAVYLYRRHLAEQLDEIKTGAPIAAQTVAAAIACKDYNAIRMLGN